MFAWPPMNGNPLAPTTPVPRYDHGSESGTPEPADVCNAAGGPTHVFLGFPAIIHSEPMRHLLITVERVARTSAAVLITGESGTGKELIARAVHYYSLRSTRPWIDLNCAALPELLIESELFGYEKGAFSGAGATKLGLFELARTG